MSEPLVSIVSGYYNREGYVDHSIKSLIEQTYKNIEIIIFDDCSTDNTYNKLKLFENDERVKIIRHSKNMGFTRGLKNAIDLSTGKYIAIHGSGDFSLSERIEKQVRFMEKNTSISVVGCNVLNIQAETGAESLHKPKKSKIREKGIYKFSYTQGEIMIRRSDYDKIGGYRSEIKYGQLSDLLYRISIIGKMDVIDETLYKRCFYNDGVSQIVYKKLLQKYYQNVSYQCAVQRVKYGEDIIDKYGDNFHIFRNKSTHLSDQYILQLYRLNLCKKDKMIVIKTSMNEKITLFNFLMFLTKGSIAIKGNKLSEFIGNLFKFEAYVRILINRYY